VADASTVLPADDRRAALAAGIEAYERGDFFLAHELLEPAWMGTADVAERELHQGLIKLAAAYVHAVRGNPAGVGKNLRGALDRLRGAVDAGSVAEVESGLDVPALVAEIERRVDALAADPSSVPPPPVLMRKVEP
jgi:predicted metal-dependent hydrolase